MDFPSLVKEKNGHHMEINVMTEQAGGFEEIYFWCHTCDPEGENLFSVDLRNIVPTTAAIRVMEFAAQHCKE